jgi:hypothetical protein
MFNLELPRPASASRPSPGRASDGLESPCQLSHCHSDGRATLARLSLNHDRSEQWLRVRARASTVNQDRDSDSRGGCQQPQAEELVLLEFTFISN